MGKNTRTHENKTKRSEFTREKKSARAIERIKEKEKKTRRGSTYLPSDGRREEKERAMVMTAIAISSFLEKSQCSLSIPAWPR
jgi:hypothetical protein